MKIDAYANVQDSCVSVRSRESDDYGRVVENRDCVTVADPEFVIQDGGQENCRELGKKTVHALVRGKWDESLKVVDGVEVVYNPFEYDYFVEADSERPVAEADVALVTKSAVFVEGLQYRDR